MVGISSKAQRSLWWSCQLSWRPTQQGVKPCLSSTAQASRIMKLHVSRPVCHRMTSHVAVPELCLKLLCGPAPPWWEALQTFWEMEIALFLRHVGNSCLTGNEKQSAEEKEELKHWSEDGQCHSMVTKRYHSLALSMTYSCSS